MDLKDLLGEAYREDMTVEDIASAIEGMDLVDRATATKGMIRKDTFDKTASELAGLKRQLREKLSEEEQEKIDREARDKAIMDELEALRKDKLLTQHVTRYLKLGYDEKLAQSTAEALVAQDFDKVFANQQAFLDAREKEIRKSQTLNNDKRPPAGNATGGTDYAKLAAEAQARGDFAMQAYYLRQSQQARE